MNERPKESIDEKLTEMCIRKIFGLPTLPNFKSIPYKPTGNKPIFAASQCKAIEVVVIPNPANIERPKR